MIFIFLLIHKICIFISYDDEAKSERHGRNNIVLVINSVSIYRIIIVRRLRLYPYAIQNIKYNKHNNKHNIFLLENVLVIEFNK